MVLIKAKVVDPTHLELSKPIRTVQGQTVLVSIAELTEKDPERQEWFTASAETLRSAYGESEPDYTAAMIKESNPDYRT
jgi:hypothetical protein